MELMRLIPRRTMVLRRLFWALFSKAWSLNFLARHTNWYLSCYNPAADIDMHWKVTKCGRYGLDRDGFDYSPKTIRRSIEHSLARLNTDYLDVVYLHDVEFVAEEIMPRRSGDHTAALGTEAELYGLGEGQEAKVWGPGDQRVLDAYQELRKLQAEGVIRHIGITGKSHTKSSRCLLRFTERPSSY